MLVIYFKGLIKCYINKNSMSQQICEKYLEEDIGSVFLQEREVAGSKVREEEKDTP